MGSSLLVGPTVVVTTPGLQPVVVETQLGLKENGWLVVEHPTYTWSKAEWKRHERAARGGKEVEIWLHKFDWEERNGQHYIDRCEQLTWLNFGDRFATILVGHMMRESPEPDWGTLGKVSRTSKSALPSPAELIKYNTDGVGRDGSQWENFWTNACRWAVVDGHQYIWAHGPKERPLSRLEEIAGKRPYLERLSPLTVTNWLDDRGSKQFAIIRRYVRNPTITKEKYWNSNVSLPEYVLLVRKGCTIFDPINPDFSKGGWFTFDYTGAYQPEQSGDWSATQGEIPLFTLYYERVSDPGTLSMSRSGISQMVNCDVAYMNLSSAADFDTFDSATSTKGITGIDDNGFNLAIQKEKAGNRKVPLINTAKPDAHVGVVDMGSKGNTSTEFEARLRAKRNEAMEFMLNEIQIAPDSSGIARQASFSDVREPRLALLATEIETTQNATIDALERLWGASNPTGSAEWPREFRLLDPVTVASDFFTVENIAGVTSKTAGAKVLTAAARETGIIGDDDEEAIVLKEYQEALQARADANAAISSMAGAMNLTRGTPGTGAGAAGIRKVPATSREKAAFGSPTALGADTKQAAPAVMQTNSGNRNAGAKN